MLRSVAAAARDVQSEFLMITPYFVPAEEELQLLRDMRARNARVRLLTNSLEASPDPMAHSGYQRYRVPLLQDGVELYEIRSQLDSTRGSGQTAAVSSHGNYSLHAKLFVFDRRKIFIGSINFDQRSKRLNTEVGLLIDSAELADQTAARFDAMTRPEASYALSLRPREAGAPAHLVWDTKVDSAPVHYDREPARSEWQRFTMRLLMLLPLDSEL